MIKTVAAILSTALLFAPVALAQPKPAADAPAKAAEAPAQPAATLKPGDPAPKLQTSRWLKGEPIEDLEKGKVYIMEFWATWCGPCIAAMPHVTELQAKYKDKGVVVIGMNVWERDLTKVEPFVEKNGAKMGYAVAMDVVADGNRGAMATTWMSAAGKNGIPCSFIIDREGKIAWIGHPLMMDRPLAAVVEGKFDLAKEAELEKKMNELSKEYSQAASAKEYDKAIAILDQLNAMDSGLSSFRDAQKIGLLLQKEDYAAAQALAAKIGEGEDHQAAGRAASVLLSAKDQDKLDAALIMKLAEKVAAKADKDDISSAMLLARAHAAKKDFAKAISILEEARKTAPAQYHQFLDRTIADIKKREESAKPQ